MLLSKKECLEFDPYLFSFNYFPTQIFMDQNQRPISYYCLPVIKGDYTPTTCEQKVFKWLKFLADQSAVGQHLLNWMTELWPTRIVTQVKSFSSFVILIEGPLPEFNIRKQKLITHNHLPRHGKSYHNTLTILKPLYLNTEVNQYFNYADLDQAGINYLQEESAFAVQGLNFADRWKHLANSYVYNPADLEKLIWANIKLPNENNNLEIKFNAARYVHNVSGHKQNIFAAATFNDVEFYQTLSEPGIEYEYYNTIVQPR